MPSPPCWPAQVSVWLYEVLTGVVLGAAIGHVAGAVLRWAERRRLIENDSLFAFSIVLAVSVVSGCTRGLRAHKVCTTRCALTCHHIHSPCSTQLPCGKVVCGA